MRVFFTIIMLFIFSLLHAQAGGADAVSGCENQKFETQGEAENCWAKQLFENNYQKQTYPKFNGKITVSGDTVRYADQTLIVFVPKEYKSIFVKGLLYPSIFGGGYVPLSISAFKELLFLNKNPTQKRFRFWLFYGFKFGSEPLISNANPTVYFIELTNPNATDKTSIEDFINGATLTFFKKGWRII